MRTSRKGAVGAIVALLLLVTAAACGGSGGGSSSSSSTKPKGAITIGSFNFPESVVLANLYAGALREAGYQTTVRANLGARDLVYGALKKGELDMVPEYVGNALVLLFPDKAAVGDDVATTAKKLGDAVKADGLSVTTPSNATDGDIIAVTKATAAKYSLKKISDLAPVASKLTLGGPPECQTRITCYKGLQDVYGLKGLKFKPLDTGAITKASLEKGDIDLARLFSADPVIKEKSFVALEDDKFIQPAGNIIPMIRTEKLTAEVTQILNKVSSTLTTDDLITMNRKTDVEKQDAEVVAQQYLLDKGLIKKK
jgi:osmoprotectant transport system substrate-binding protein